MQELKNQLVELGFSKNDALVYLALVEKSSSTAGPLINSTGLHRNIVYTSLVHLLARKLITEKKIRGIKHFSPASPEILRSEFLHKKEIAEKTATALSALISHEAQEISIHQGNEEYLQLLTGLLRALPPGSTKYVLGTGGETFMENTMRPIWKDYHQVAEAQKISIRMLAYESQKTAIEPDIQNLAYYSVRYLPDETENPAGVHIYPEAQTVLNIIYSDSHTPVTAIKIRNPALVHGYLNLFNNLWKTAKE